VIHPPLPFLPHSKRTAQYGGMEGQQQHDDESEVDHVKASPIEMPHEHKDAPDRSPTTDDSQVSVARGVVQVWRRGG